MLMIVLLNDAWTCATASRICRFDFLRTFVAAAAPAAAVPAGAVPAAGAAAGAAGAVGLGGWAIISSSLDYFRTGRRGPLRVRAFVRVRWPRSGRPRR